MKSMDVNDKTSIDNVNNKKLTDYRELGEKIPIGSIVATYAHPYSESNTKVMITSYSHFTPPLMVVSEKKYGSKFNPLSGDKEDNDSYKCVFYSTLSGTLEEKWFKRKELKYISTGDPSFFNNHKGKSVEELKKEFFGRMAILSSVDIELGKKKIWSETIDQSSKSKVNNLLDFLPPLGAIIDVKHNDDYQKYNEKEGKIIHRKSKLMVKLRWFNNKTGKHSEEYFPMVGLKLLEKEELILSDFKRGLYYGISDTISLEGNTDIEVNKSVLKFHDVIWKHYFYIYRFKDCYTRLLRDFKQKDLDKVSEISDINPTDLDGVFKGTNFKYNKRSEFFNGANKEAFEKRWFEIEYLDRSGRYTQRMIYIETFEEEKVDMGTGLTSVFLKANCLLRQGRIRHFNVSRIKSYRKLPKIFVDKFISNKMNK